MIFLGYHLRGKRRPCVICPVLHYSSRVLRWTWRWEPGPRTGCACRGDHRSAQSLARLTRTRVRLVSLSAAPLFRRQNRRRSGQGWPRAGRQGRSIANCGRRLRVTEVPPTGPFVGLVCRAQFARLAFAQNSGDGAASQPARYPGSPCLPRPQDRVDGVPAGTSPFKSDRAPCPPARSYVLIRIVHPPSPLTNVGAEIGSLCDQSHRCQVLILSLGAEGE